MHAFLAAVEPGTNGIEVTETLIVGLMLVAALVGIAVNRLRLPYTVALVLVGLGLGVSGTFGAINLTSELILLVFLPPLLFDGAINMDLGDLILRWRQVAVLAFVGAAISASVIGLFLVLVPGMSAEHAVIFAVILAATDPVSVLAIFKENGVVSGLRTLMEGESIFNDAIVIVAYLIAVEIAFSDVTVTFQDALTEFGIETAVGVGAGAAVGFLAHRLMATLDDHLVEITLSLVTAYGAYLLADRLGGSGVIAVVASGLLIGNYGTRMAMSASSRVTLREFWEVLAFLANSALFLVIGLEFEIDALRGRTLIVALVGIAGVLMSRAIIAYGLLWPFTRSSIAPVPTSWMTAVFWGGLRGSIPIALVLGLPVKQFAGVNAVAVVFAVVLFSLVVQGVTYRPVLDRLGLTSQTDELNRYEEHLAETLAIRAALSELKTMRRSGEITERLYKELNDDLTQRLETQEAEVSALTQNVEGVRNRQIRVSARRLAAVQKRALSDASRSGRISDDVARKLARHIDIELEERPTEVAADLADGEDHGTVTESRQDHVVPPDQEVG
ncbi:Na+/H+ antiporter [Ilumatobacter sp.]|uniref:Na+/H+ antiporter n=2 Tax=Ilumatobacter sp. TaxID=1967498 RepID=UPI003751A6C7